jgi:NADPH-dependent 2,4-dienoyl-CoA reductase/sulfur reductase-like enzyme
MADPRIVVVGAGPAGVRAAQTLVEAGLRPTVVDESPASGGQIYRRQPALFRRSYETLYGFEADRAKALHNAFDGLANQVDYRPDTLAWNVYDGVLHTLRDGVAGKLPFDALILATGATDRLLPIKGWTLPGCYSMGAAQIALKAQACAIGRRVVFLGTGPLLYLVSYQYAKAGVEVAAVLDTSPAGGQLGALPHLASRPALLAKGLYYRAQLMARGVTVHNGVVPLEIEGPESVAAVRFRDGGGQDQQIACDAVGMGFHLRSETQLARISRSPAMPSAWASTCAARPSSRTSRVARSPSTATSASGVRRPTATDGPRCRASTLPATGPASSAPTPQRFQVDWRRSRP